jgi:very-short-patch-repair endonuclease
MLPFNRKLKIVARGLRQNMTDAERTLWSRIRRKQIRGFQFYRQKNIGDYIVDFYCPRGKLIIEVDGGQHYCAEKASGDRKRDRHLWGLRFRVMRFSDREVLRDIDSVAEAIWRCLENPLQLPFIKGRDCSKGAVCM